MKITLYKNCIFSRSYSEVCDCRIKDTNGKTALDRYLATLAKEVFEIDTVYSTNAGTLNLPIQFPNSTDSLYDFNYLKIEYESLTRYCFIDNIQFMNYVAVVSYSEDIWHSYSGDMILRKGLLSNVLHFSYGENGVETLKQIYLPTEYISKQRYILPNKFETFVIFAQIQRYKLSNETTNKRETYSAILGRFTMKTPNIAEAWYYNSFNEAEEAAKTWVANAGIEKTNDNWYYEIDNFTIIPYEYLTQKGVLNIVDLNASIFIFSQGENPLFYFACGLKHDYFTLKVFSANGGNYKRIGIGTMTATYETVETNRDYLYDLDLYTDSTDVKLLLNLQGKIIDITDNFVFEIPFTGITGDVTAQRKLARSMETVNGVRQIVSGVSKIGTSIAEAIITGGASEATAVAGKAAANRLINSYHYNRRSVEYKNAMAKVANAEARSANANVEMTGGVISGIDSVVGGIQGIISANSPVYMSQTGTFVQGNKGLSCQYGIFEKIPIPDNENEVDGIIKEIGYRTNQIVTDSIFAPFNITGYNILKFGSVIIYGKFPQSVCERLKEILINGIKIWYDENSI